MINTIISLLLSFGIVSSGYGIGTLVSKLFTSKDRSKGEIFIINSSFGMGFLSILYFFFSSLQLLKKPFIYIMLGITLIFSLYGLFLISKNLILAFKRSLKESKEKTPKKSNKLHMLMLATMIVGLSITAISALAPSVSEDWDSLAYHLAVPKMFLEHGGFYYINFTSHSNFPMLQELLYIPSIFLGYPVGAKLLSFWFGIFAIITAGYIISRYFNKTAVIWTSFIIFSMPIFLWSITTAYIDIASAFFVLLAVYFTFSYIDTKNKKDLIACGLAIGFTASLKMTGIQFILLFPLWILIDNAINAKHINWKNILYIIIPALIICMPWYIKTFIFTGNPVYPFFYEIFGGRDWTQELATTYSNKQSLFGIGHNLQSFVMTPLQMTIKPKDFYDQPGLYIGPLLLIIFPCICLLVQVHNRKLFGLGAIIIIQYLIWFAMSHQSRYLMPMFLCSAVFIPAILYSINGIKLIRGALIFVFAVAALSGMSRMYAMAFNYDRYSVITGQITNDEYISKYFKSYSCNKYINSLPKNQEILVGLIGDTEGFYLNKPYVWADSSHNKIFNHQYKTPEELVKTLIKNKITHVIVPFGFPGIGKRDNATGNNLMVFEALDKGYFIKEFPNDLFSREMPAEVYTIDYKKN